MHKTIAYTSKSSAQIVKPPSLFKPGFRFFVCNRGVTFYCNSCTYVLKCPLLKQVNFSEKTVFAIQHSTLASLIYVSYFVNTFPVSFASPGSLLQPQQYEKEKRAPVTCSFLVSAFFSLFYVLIL